MRVAILMNAIVSVALAGCATIGSDFEADRARQLRKGMSREAVVTLMGVPPVQVEGGDSWRLVWLYAEADPIGFGVTQKRLSVTFDAQGRADRITVTGSGAIPAP